MVLLLVLLPGSAEAKGEPSTTNVASAWPTFATPYVSVSGLEPASNEGTLERSLSRFSSITKAPSFLEEDNFFAETEERPYRDGLIICEAVEARVERPVAAERDDRPPGDNIPLDCVCGRDPACLEDGRMIFCNLGRRRLLEPRRDGLRPLATMVSRRAAASYCSMAPFFRPPPLYLYVPILRSVCVTLFQCLSCSLTS